MAIGFDEIQLEKTEKDTIVTLTIKKKLDKEDYERFVPMIERQMEAGAPIRLLVELHDFEGWTAGALWEDTKFAARHFKSIERMAVVANPDGKRGAPCFSSRSPLPKSVISTKGRSKRPESGSAGMNPD